MRPPFLRSFVDGLADLDHVVENRRVNQARRRHGVVLVGKGREDFGR
jgi:hypothetical protein